MESDTFLSLIPINPLLHTGCHRDSKLGSNTTIKNSRENNVSRETRQRSMNKSVTFAKIAVPAPAPFLLVAIGKSSSPRIRKRRMRKQIEERGAATGNNKMGNKTRGEEGKRKRKWRREIEIKGNETRKSKNKEEKQGKDGNGETEGGF